MEEFVSYNGKKLRKGYTTGTCAAAASLGSILMIRDLALVDSVRVTTPSGVDLVLTLEDQAFDRTSASCCVVKDAGDDIDVTDGARIYSKVSLRDDGQIIIDGGQGVGRICQEGHKLEVGQAAINPVPRQQIRQLAEDNLPQGQGADIVISVPNGEELAKSTFNSRLGIEGGISILGTTGIVTPMSEEGWKAAISMELEMKASQGLDRVILTPGNYGQAFVEEELGLNSKYLVQMSNFIGYVLLECVRLGFKKILLVGHMGKFIKIAGGIFSTHSKDADARAEIMVANLALMGADQELLEEVYQAPTTEIQAGIIIQAGYKGVYDRLVDRIKARVLQLLEPRDPSIEVEVISFLIDHDILARTKDLRLIEEVFQ